MRDKTSDTTKPTQEGLGQPAIPFGCFHFLDKHGQHHGLKGWNAHYLTNDKACMPDNIYSGAGTRLMINRDNNSIRDIRMHAITHRVNAPLVKDHMLHVKVYK
jgi:hypothetical protein